MSVLKNCVDQLLELRRQLGDCNDGVAVSKALLVVEGLDAYLTYRAHPQLSVFASTVREHIMETECFMIGQASRTLREKAKRLDDQRN